MWTNKTNKLRFAVLLLALIWATTAAGWATLVPPGSAVGPPPGTPGDGLDGSYWDVFVVFPHNATADTIIVTTPPTATFHSTHVDYPNGAPDVVSDATTLSTFLGVDAGSLTPASEGSDTLSTSLFEFKGFIKIVSAFDTIPTTPGIIDMFFSVGSDDGMRLKIGGVTIAEHDAPRAFGFTGGSAEFGAEGLYPIQLINWEHFGFTGVESHSSIPGGPASGAPAGTAGIVPTSVLYTSAPTAVPEPASLSLLGLGLLLAGSGTLRRGRRKT